MPAFNVLEGAMVPLVASQPVAGLSYFLTSAATTNAVLIKTGTTTLQSAYLTNTGAAAAYVKLFNKAAAPVPASDVPVMVLVIPAAVSGVPGVVNLNGSIFRFPLGLGIAVVTGAADLNAVAVAAAQVKVAASYN